MPGRAGEDARRGAERRGSGRDPGAQQEVLAALDRPQVRDDVEAGVVGRIGLVDRGQPVEVAEPELVAGGGEGLDPGVRRQVDGLLAVRRVDRRPVAVPRRQPGRPGRQSSTWTEVIGPRGARAW